MGIYAHIKSPSRNFGMGFFMLLKNRHAELDSASHCSHAGDSGSGPQ